MDDVEKVARALAAANSRRDVEAGSPQWQQLARAYDIMNDDGRNHYRELARVACETVRAI